MLTLSQIHVGLCAYGVHMWDACEYCKVLFLSIIREHTFTIIWSNCDTLLLRKKNKYEGLMRYVA